MSDPKETPASAFPVSIMKDTLFAEHGMSKRDWFAGQALASVADDCSAPTSIAIRAYAIADAMLKEGGA